MKLGVGGCIVQKYRSIIAPGCAPPAPQNVALGYDVGKISACCLVEYSYFFRPSRDFLAGEAGGLGVEFGSLPMIIRSQPHSTTLCHLSIWCECRCTTLLACFCHRDLQIVRGGLETGVIRASAHATPCNDIRCWPVHDSNRFGLEKIAVRFGLFRHSIALCLRHRKAWVPGVILFSGVSVRLWVSLCVPKTSWTPHISKIIEWNFTQFWSQVYLGS